jgi:sulfur-carrier protein adenylyltransferase/sulfurtransferase
MQRKDFLLTQTQKDRYSRQINLREFDLIGQIELIRAKVLIVGCGGLGNAVAPYLAAAGVGTIGLVDSDLVELSNLPRQVVFRESQLGMSKATALSANLTEINSETVVVVIEARIDSVNADLIIPDYDVIVDCSDNFNTKYLLDEKCRKFGIPLVFGAVHRFVGQIGVFNFNGSGSYSDLYPAQPESPIPNCAQDGVIGPMPGIIGSMQALEVIKILTRIGEPITNRILIFDGQTAECHTFVYKKSIEQKEIIAGMKCVEMDHSLDLCYPLKQIEMIKEITVQELKAKQDSGENIKLIDVREPFEFQDDNLGGVLIPMGEVPSRLDEIPQTGEVVIHCKSGARSASIVTFLQTQKGYTNVYNLKGGIMAWRQTFGR